MKALMRRVVWIGILTTTVTCLVGCISAVGVAMHKEAAKGFLTYAQTKAAWEPVPDGCGRVVLFADSSSVLTYYPGLYIYEIDATFKTTTMPDGTFVFIDLPSGKHSFKCYIQSSLYHGKTTEFTLLPGEIKYVRGLADKIVTSQEAEERLEDVYHLFKKPLPFDKQEESAERIEM